MIHKHLQDPDSALGEGEFQSFLTLGDSTNALFSRLVDKGELYKELCEVRDVKHEPERLLTAFVSCKAIDVNSTYARYRIQTHSTALC